MAATRTRNFRLDDDREEDFAYRLGLAVLAVMAALAMELSVAAANPVEGDDTCAFAAAAGLACNP